MARSSGVLHLDLVGVAPAPVFARFEGLDDGVFGLVEVFGGVAIRRAIATTDMSAREAQTQVDPTGADLQAIFASLRARRHLVDLVEVRTFCHYRPPEADKDDATFISDSFPEARPEWQNSATP
jgi:hypothetical protein